MISADFGERLRHIRKSAEWSQKKLGLAIGFTSGRMISQWELGERYPNAEQIDVICRSLQCTANELFGHSGYSQTEEVAGLRWHVNPPDIDELGSDEIIDGMKAFRMLVADGLQSKVVLNRDAFRKFGPTRLGRLLQMAFLTGAIYGHQGST